MLKSRDINIAEVIVGIIIAIIVALFLGRKRDD
jgi:multisubunit Na+/H+ antiporter MnhE subunit